MRDNSPRIEFAPAYELVVSLAAFLHRPGHRTLDLGAGWVSGVREGLEPVFATELSRYKELPATGFHLLMLLVSQCPGPRDAAGFLRWAWELPLGELYERVVPCERPDKTPLTRDLSGTREQLLSLLERWHDQYFRTVSPEILSHLAADAGAKQQQAPLMKPADLVEMVTGGLVMEPGDQEDEVILVPQYHFRPTNLFAGLRGLLICLYPADDLPADPESPPPRLLRVARALADESRLRILRLLSREALTLTDIAARTGLSPGTVHHHLVTMRSAGLIRVHGVVTNPTGGRYTLRPAGLDELSGRLSQFLKGESV